MRLPNLRDVDRNALRAARFESHYAVQWLARAARGYVAQRPDDSHTNLGWDDALGGFTTHPLPDGSRLGLKLAGLALVWLDEGHTTRSQTLVLDGRRDADIREWLAETVGAKGLDAKALDTPSPYEIPPHAIGEGAAYGVAPSAALRQLAAWYGNANLMLEAIRRRIAARKIDAPPVRCWPHHFDLDTLVVFGSGDAMHTMGVGFSPGDEYYDEPYLYVSLHPAPDNGELPPLPPIGHWHTRDFTAAIAPASRIAAAKDQRAETEAYLQTATEFGVNALG